MYWGRIDFSAVQRSLQPAGTYPATIVDVQVNEKADVVWLGVGFALDETTAAPSPILAAIAATVESEHVQRVPEGLRTLYRLSVATGVTLEGVSYEALPGLLMGKRLELVVGHGMRDGIAELVIRSMRPLSA